MTRDADNPLAFPALLTVAAALRLFLNNVAHYSPADETVYLRYAQEGYPHIVRTFLADPSLAVFPPPLRWAYIGVSQLCCHTYRGLATLSTLAGIAAVALTYVLALRLFERRTALVAAALVATSPLQLAMGRRALTDEFFCALFLLSLVLIRRRFAWIIVTTLVFATKEIFLLIYPLVLLFWWLRERKIRWEWALPPFLYFAVFCLVARDLTSFFRIAHIVTANMDAPYAAQFQNGPPQRILIDLLAVAPLVTIAFIGAAFAARAPEQRHLLFLTAGILVVHALLSSKNLRYVISADPLMRVMVAAWLPRGRWSAVALVANAAVELAIFYAIFIRGGVYDPVTQELLRALRMAV